MRHSNIYLGALYNLNKSILKAIALANVFLFHPASAFLIFLFPVHLSQKSEFLFHFFSTYCCCIDLAHLLDEQV